MTGPIGPFASKWAHGETSACCHRFDELRNNFFGELLEAVGEPLQLFYVDVLRYRFARVRCIFGGCA